MIIISDPAWSWRLSLSLNQGTEGLRSPQSGDHPRSPEAPAVQVPAEDEQALAEMLLAGGIQVSARNYSRQWKCFLDHFINRRT